MRVNIAITNRTVNALILECPQHATESVSRPAPNDEVGMMHFAGAVKSELLAAHRSCVDGDNATRGTAAAVRSTQGVGPAYTPPNVYINGKSTGPSPA